MVRTESSKFPRRSGLAGVRSGKATRGGSHRPGDGENNTSLAVFGGKAGWLPRLAGMVRTHGCHGCGLPHGLLVACCRTSRRGSGQHKFTRNSRPKQGLAGGWWCMCGWGGGSWPPSWLLLLGAAACAKTAPTPTATLRTSPFWKTRCNTRAAAATRRSTSPLRARSGILPVNGAAWRGVPLGEYCAWLMMCNSTLHCAG